MPEDESVNAARLSHEIIGDLNHGVTAFYDWNLLLDEKGGPNHVGNFCQAPFLYDTVQKKLLPQEIQRHFYHFSHFIRPGARRVAFTRYTNRLDMTAYIDPNGHLVFVMLNREEKPIPVKLRIKDEIVEFTVGKNEICTGEILN